jgi:hypothetical protein
MNRMIVYWAFDEQLILDFMGSNFVIVHYTAYMFYTLYMCYISLKKRETKNITKNVKRLLQLKKQTKTVTYLETTVRWLTEAWK